MLLGKGFDAASGRMEAMGRLLMNGASSEPSAEEIARERATVLAVQKEMSEADEANLLEEEDMHIFDQDPIHDRVSLVSCNTCKKPIKISQYAAHAERCRSLTMVDAGSFEVDAENGQRKLCRKTRSNAMLGETEPEEGTATDSGDLHYVGGFPGSKPGKRSMNGGEQSGPRIAKPRKITVKDFASDCNGEEFVTIAGPSTTGQSEGVSSKRKRQFVPFSVEDLDVMCGVPSPRSGAPCRQPLTCKSHSISSKRNVVRRKPFDVLLQELKDNIAKRSQQAEVPRPVATKLYKQNQRMRAVINNLYQESLKQPDQHQQHHHLQHQQQQQIQYDPQPNSQPMLMSFNKPMLKLAST